MTRKLLIPLLLLLSLTSARAQSTRITYGAEWGFVPALFNSHHFNYIANEGYRFDDSNSGPCFMPSGEILAVLGLDLGRYADISIKSGLLGISSGNRIIPVELDASVFLRGNASDGLFFYGGAGMGVHSHKETVPDLKPCIFSRIGTGHRIVLDRYVSVDFKAGISAAFDHVNIIEADTGTYVPGHNIRRNSAGYYALNISIALNFKGWVFD